MDPRISPGRHLGTAVLLGCLLPAQSLSAQTQELTEDLFLDELPIVLSATRLAQPLSDSPAAVTVISRDMIEASGFRNLPDLFRLVPGFQVGHESGNVSAVTYHGLSDDFSRGLQVLVDGRSVYTPAFGGVEWSDLPIALDDIERIEVIRGPNAATHGANAFLGVINISTRHAAEDFGSRVSLSHGSDGVSDMFLRHADSTGDLDYRLTLGVRGDEGFETRNDNMRMRLATLRADFQASARDSLHLQLGVNQGARQKGFSSIAFEPEQASRIRSHFQQLEWQHVAKDGDEWSLRFYHNAHNTSEIWGGGAALPDPADVNAERFDLEGSYQSVLSPASRLVWGGSARLDRVRAPLHFNRGGSVDNHLYRLFGNWEWQASRRWLLNAGLMVENNDVTDTDTSPRLALNFHVTPGHTLRWSISKALRTPVVFENNGDWSARLNPLVLPVPPLPPSVQLFAGPGDLAPERILSRELGYLGHFERLNLQVDLRLFNDQLSRLIDTIKTPTPVPGVNTLTFANRLTATVRGAEAGLKWRPGRSSMVNLSWSNADVDSVDGGLEESTPRNTISLLAYHRFPGGLQLNTGYYQVSEMRWLGNGDDIPFYRRLDLGFAYTLPGLKRRVRISGTLQNLFDDYNDFRINTIAVENNLFDRRMYLTVQTEI